MIRRFETFVLFWWASHLHTFDSGIVPNHWIAPAVLKKGATQFSSGSVFRFIEFEVIVK